jgi:hypothetical protein
MNKTFCAMNQDEITALGASLRQIDQKLLKQKKDVERIWYQGDEPYFDLFFEQQNSEIIWFQFTLRGKSLCWGKENQILHTGKTNEFTPNDITYYAASKLVNFDRQIDWSFIELVEEILKSRKEEVIFKQALAILHNLRQSLIN